MAFTKISRSLSPQFIKCKSAKSHLYFKQQNAVGGKTAIRLTCESNGNCQTTHYINFSNNLLRIFGLEGNVAHHASLKIRKSNSNVYNTLTFIKLGFLSNPQAQLYLSEVKIPIACGAVFPINCSFIVMFARLI